MLQHGCRLEISGRNISQHCLTIMLVSVCPVRPCVVFVRMCLSEPGVLFMGHRQTE